MLNRWSVLVLVVGALAGYNVAGSSAQAQSESLPFAVVRFTITTGNSSVRAIAGKAPRHRWHLWQRRQSGMCNLQTLKDARESESQSLRQTSLALRASFVWAGPSARPGSNDLTKTYKSSHRQRSLTISCERCPAEAAKLRRRTAISPTRNLP